VAEQIQRNPLGNLGNLFGIRGISGPGLLSIDLPVATTIDLMRFAERNWNQTSQLGYVWTSSTTVHAGAGTLTSTLSVWITLLRASFPSDLSLIDPGRNSVWLTRVTGDINAAGGLTSMNTVLGIPLIQGASLIPALVFSGQTVELNDGTGQRPIRPTLPPQLQLPIHIPFGTEARMTSTVGVALEVTHRFEFWVGAKGSSPPGAS